MTATSCKWLRHLRALVTRGPAEHAAEHRAWLAFWVALSTLLVTCSPLQFDRTIRQARGGTQRLSTVNPGHPDTGYEDVALDVPSNVAPVGTSVEPGTAADGATSFVAPVDKAQLAPDARVRLAVLPSSGALATRAAFRLPGRAPPHS